jgi:SAM-dependent methyltransferase
VPGQDGRRGYEDLASHFACPACRAPLEQASTLAVRCPADGSTFERVEGIWRFLPPRRLAFYERFIREYEAVRQAEGRGFRHDADYRALPFEDRTGRFAEDWRIRAASYRAFVRRVLETVEKRQRRHLRILDLGSGNGWLSYRLSQRGHAVAAVDLAINRDDGLGAHARFDAGFLPLQAEYDRVPFHDGLFDLVIYNASFHYSVDYTLSLREAMRVLTAEGQVVILDSPVYHDPASGEEMVRERQALFRRCYGFPSDALPSENYLTYRRLEDLGADMEIAWRLVQPFYGLRWALRPMVARARHRREPAAFLVIAGSRSE